jgi:mono/diheme cytochrome c family protein
MNAKKIFLIPITILLINLSACSFSLAEDITPPPGSQVQPGVQTQSAEISGPVYPIVPPDPAQGASIYAEKCAPCHGASGMGNGVNASKLTVSVAQIGNPELARQASPARWFTIVTQGNMERFMPGFTSLNDRQRWDVVAYAFSLSVSSETLTQGAQLYQENCAECHGEMGKGNGPAAAGLATPPGDFTDQAFMADKTATTFYTAIQKGVASSMPAYGDKFTEAQLWNLADYLRGLSFASTATTAVDVEATTPEPTLAAGAEITPLPEIISGTGTVTIQVINGSGASLPAELPVTLYGFDNMELIYTRTLTTGENGSFTFDDVELLAGRAFLAGVEYQGGTYGSDVSVAPEAATTLTLPVTVYDSTTETSNLVIDRMHLFFDFTTPDVVQVVELYIISNPTNLAVIGEEPNGPVLTFTLPENAQDLQFQDGMLGERYVEIPGGFADTLTVRPGAGEYQVLFAYNLPYSRSLVFNRPLNLPANAIVVLMPESGVKLKTDMLQDGGSRDVQGIAYQMYTGGNLTAGSELNLELSGKPKASAPTLTPSESRTNLLIGLGALGLTLILMGIWLYRRSQSDNGENGEDDDEDEEEAVVNEAEAAPGDPDTLMDAIIALDELYKSGELPEEAYQVRRAELKEQLKKALIQENSSSNQ